MLRPNSFPIVFVALLFVLTGCGFVGWGSGELDLDPSQVEVHLSFDKETYQLGEAITATIEVKNLAEAPAVLSVPGAKLCQIYARPESAKPDDLALVEFVSAPDEQIEQERVEAGESISRKLLLHRFTRKPGRFAFLLRYRTDVEGISSAVEAASEIVSLTVSEQRMFERDRDGLILESEAQRIARAHFKAAPDAPAESMLANDETRLDTWLVTVQVPAKDGKTESKSALISPFTGKVRRDVATTVAAERAKTR